MRILRRTDFAWEFLRRNDTYRRCARTARGPGCDHRAAHRWGLQFCVDPARPATQVDVYWRQDAAPHHVVHLRRAGPSTGLRLEDVGITAKVQGQHGLHLQLRGGLQAFAEECSLSDPVAAVIPITGSFSAALKGISDLERVLRGEAPGDDLTAQQRLRLHRALSALDAFQAKATYRQVALEIFGAEAVSRYDWRTSSVRDAAIRLVRMGRALAAGGYLKLLAPGQGALAGSAGRPGLATSAGSRDIGT